MVDERAIEEGMELDLKVEAKGARGEGIGKVGDFVIFVNHAKTRIGNIYKVKITKLHRTFGYAELAASAEKFIGNGSVIEL
ncbi:TRAM domain-containing protein [Candidatus Marsarchaeota archaeon]|nr:TRAM domain-containing protein [Candidatus Marsarchaeota archaeon]